MREITDINEIKKIELNILLQFDAFCKQNGLRYFLAYGTLIGAVRHKGFIPWDDDIDILMPRAEYDWLIANYNKFNPNGRFRVVRPVEDVSPFSFVKFVDNHTIKIQDNIDYSNQSMGIDIDIFPLDGQPEDEEDYQVWCKKLEKIYNLHLGCSRDTYTTLKRRIFVPLLRIAVGGRVSLLRKASRLHQKYPYENSKYIGTFESSANSAKERFPKEWFAQSVEVPFEDYAFPIPVGYDSILRKIYGDYMKFPPVECQVPHHFAKYYVKEEED